LLRIQERPEDAGRIKAWEAAPVDRAVFADKRDRMQIANHGVVFNWNIARFHRQSLPSSLLAMLE
jgi:hypothetical protein